ncbi:hypothetical protein MPC4_250054 [Methylocella tundrae]|uniref:Uncharacterized protein n=1 Tax=Methylocella tundrae TaxID=227605 RepID=A0A8B6M6T3_METTU|nr:hypothetical protein MPC4_250054 [Methylocella tundrae]
MIVVWGAAAFTAAGLADEALTLAALCFFATPSGFFAGTAFLTTLESPPAIFAIRQIDAAAPQSDARTASPRYCPTRNRPRAPRSDDSNGSPTTSFRSTKFLTGPDLVLRQRLQRP